ncbi:ras-related protein Rab-40B isoform X3 [Cebus imitator]|uniref:ras-related protein Rab-40B isoform X3 n=1 Tax=Cebus imitator TaxID=2715852 RepID=UPI00080A4089|nr:ras-related protein Rab-40B isoform X3 [Cebus imitator]
MDRGRGIDYKTTTILLDGRRVKLQLWDTSGQGRFCTIFRSYSRGAQGVILVYDIANRWSFDGIDRWIKEIDEGPMLRFWVEVNLWGFLHPGHPRFSDSKVSLSAELARPLLPGCRVLHAGAPGGQAAAAHRLTKPPQVLLHGQRPERQDDAWTVLLPYHQLHPQKEQPPQGEARPPAPEPTQTLHQKQLQNFVRKALHWAQRSLSGRNSVPPRQLAGASWIPVVSLCECRRLAACAAPPGRWRHTALSDLGFPRGCA